jgi:hypothetical protein
MAPLALVALLLLGAAPPPDADTLAIIDNTLRHEGPPPRSAFALVRELLGQPLAATDAREVFDRVTPRPLIEAASPVAPAPAQPFQALLDAFVAEAGRARTELLVATGNAPWDEAALLAELAAVGHPAADRLLQVAAASDLDGVAVANQRFIEATVRFARALQTASGVPAQTTRIDSPVGTIIIGSRGDDVHDLKPATGGAISVVIDLGGNDTYKGSDVAVRGFSAIIDVAGNDRYEMSGPGLGAAVAGAALLLDLGGDDSYRAPHIGQGMAAFGVGALLDLAGDDRYDLGAWGQGFGLAGGLGLLWDAAGNDRYVARGPRDAYDRGGGLSGAQGAAMGPRTMLAGGIGILRDDGGDDEYVAEMFAQGIGYYYGLGLLWDRGGDDRYTAVRYAQGTGVHEAVGILRDESGSDAYRLSVGVGQGMGLDLAVGALLDDSGDDQYFADLLAQAAATANGVGILEDRAGRDRFEVAQGDRQWGHAQWLRGMPTVGVLRFAPGAVFVTGGKTLGSPPPPRKVLEAGPPPPRCPPGVVIERAEIEALRRDSFDVLYAFAGKLRCAAEGEPARTAELWQALDDELARDPASPLATWIALVYGDRPPGGALGEDILRRLDAHPSCGVRALALDAAPRADLARRAIGSSCYRLQAAALRALEKLGEPAPAGAALPSFLR